ncbi:MAG: prepilin-type N-terminal cleavage/methylation domain-containing protein [Phycisphaerales bacterium]
MPNLRSSIFDVRSSIADRRSHIEHGFTLVELLVVVSIIALLIAILLPALGKAKAVAQGVRCSANQRQIGVAGVSYAGDYNDQLPPAAFDRDQNGSAGDQQDTCFYGLWTYLGYDTKNFKHPDNDFQSGLPGGLRGTDRNVFHCPITQSQGPIFYPSATQPGSTDSYSYNYTPIAAIVGPPAYADWSKIRASTVSMSRIQMPASTAMVVEATTHILRHWEYYTNGLIPHNDGMNTLFLDIHVQTVQEPNIPFQGGNPDAVSAFWSGLAK